jgi:uncharacterized membrane protein YhaH (DUF805 family)
VRIVVLVAMMLLSLEHNAAAAITGRDLRLHDARRGEQLMMLFTIVAVGGRLLRRRVVGRLTRTSMM